MANEKKGILHGDELLYDVALRSIGIGLPDEYVLRFMRLMEKVGQSGLDKVTLADIAEIEHDARQEMGRRMSNGGVEFKPVS